MLTGKRIVVTGLTGQVAFPIAREPAKANDVIGLARFSRPADRERLAAVGVRCVTVDLAADALDAVPEDADYVLHFAVAKSREADFDRDLEANAEATGRLMARCRRARGFLLRSSTGVYQPAGHHPLRETDPLGDNHRVIMPTYSIAKIATRASSAVRLAVLGLTFTISNAVWLPPFQCTSISLDTRTQHRLVSAHSTQAPIDGPRASAPNTGG